MDFKKDKNVDEGRTIRIEGEIHSVQDVLKLLKELIGKVKKKDKRDDFIKYLSKNILNFGVLFRGEMNYGKTALTPYVFRPIKQGGKEHPLDETSIVEYLSSVSTELISLKSDFDRLCYMQHYGIPTRLLDWSSHPLVALYFVAKKGVERDGDIDGMFYLLNYRLLNHVSSLRKAPVNLHDGKSFGTKFRVAMAFFDKVNHWSLDTGAIDGDVFRWDDEDLNWTAVKVLTGKDCVDELSPKDKVKLFCSPICVRPNVVNPRIIHQSGLFTLHGGKKTRNNGANYDPDSSEPLPEPLSILDLREKVEKARINQDNFDGGDFLKVYKIPKEYLKNIYDELNLLNFHDGVIFPELEKKLEVVSSFIYD